jgi:HEPN domain-containing protein
MPEYDLDFATKLAEVADGVNEKDPRGYDAGRVTIYLSRLSAEITLKALLERAGVPVAKIRRRSHNLRALLKDFGECEVEVEIAPDQKR